MSSNYENLVNQEIKYSADYPSAGTTQAGHIDKDSAVLPGNYCRDMCFSWERLMDKCRKQLESYPDNELLEKSCSGFEDDFHKCLVSCVRIVFNKKVVNVNRVKSNLTKSLKCSANFMH